MNIERIVPIDERLERQARRWIDSDHAEWRVQGAAALRYFRSDRTIAALKALADEGSIPPSRVSDAIEKYGVDINKPNPHMA